MENKAIVVTALETGDELLRLKRLHLAPGEMEKISVPAEALQKSPGGIKVSIE